MEAAPKDAVIGRMVDGRYSVTRRISRGGMATVYHAIDRRLEREVAVKIMHPHLADAEDFVIRFRREARAAAQLSHPNVVGVFDQGLWEGAFYLTMEYIEGEDLRARLRREHTLPLGEALEIAASVAEAMAAAHRRELVHRDIKPENVMIDTDGAVKVADFGLARAFSEATAASTGTLLGTVAYLGPELVMHGQTTPAADVYATGILLYEMITGTQPFTGEMPINVAMQHVNSQVPAPSELVEWLPPSVDNLVAALTARQLGDRLPDGAAALAAIRATAAEIEPELLARRAHPAALSGSASATESADNTAPLARKVSAGTVALPLGALEAAAPSTAKPRHTRRNRRGILFGALTLLVAAGVGLTWFFMNGPGAFATVPSVEGKSADEAAAILSDAGFDPTLTSQNDDAVPPGAVIGTDPPPGSEARRGSEVSVVVSAGVLMLTMPELTDLTGAEAAAALQAQGFPVPELTENFSENVAQGQLISAVNAEDDAPIVPGESYDHRTVVRLDISKGREPVALPDMRGQQQDNAEASLKALGLKVVIVVGDFSETVPEGAVISQSPLPAEITETNQLYRGDTVTLTISQGMPFVEVPNLFGMKAKQASDALKKLGLVPAPTYQWEGKLDIVRFQDPGAGTKVRKGSTVSFTVV